MQRVQTAVATLTPGYFALVMGSGIISVGMRLEGFETISTTLLAICTIAFVTLCVLTTWRFVAYRSAIVEDFVDPRRAFGFFTFVAGANVLGVRLSMDGHHTTTGILLVVSGAAWLLLGYVIPWTAVLSNAARPVVVTANGTWFIWVVASESVAVAAATLEPVVTTGRQELAVLAVTSWSVGVFLYGAAAVIVSLRLMLYDFGPEDLTPPYWVAMGALAITVLAGARIVEMTDAPMVSATRGLIAGLCVMFWSFATWLIPVLVVAGGWRHLVHRIPLRYEATWWSIVFPLGMYAVAGIYLGRAADLPLVEQVGSTELWLAMAAWILALVGMGAHLIGSVLLDHAPEPAMIPTTTTP
jgi:tellurite resistance protein TehA-like permease